MGLWRTLSAAWLVTAALLPRVATGLFEDEVGQYEWALQQIGQPLAFAYSSDMSDRVFVSSASGVVASVLLKDGKMQWRRVANAKGAIKILRASKKGLLSVTDEGTVHAWKSTNGDLVWQREYGDVVLDLTLTGKGSKQLAVVLRKGEIEARTTAGKQEWAATTSEAGTSGRFWPAWTTQEDGNIICVVAAGEEGSNPQTLHIDSTGKTTKTVDLPEVVADGLKHGFIVVDSYIVSLQQGKIVAVSIPTGQMFSMEIPKSDEGLQLSEWRNAVGVFAAKTESATTVYGISEKGLKRLRSFNGVAIVGPIFSPHEDETGQPVVVAVTKEDSTQIQLMDPASGNVQPAINVPGYSADDHGPAQLLLTHELKSGEHRTIIAGADHSFAGIQGGKVLWVREEGLASINQAVFYNRAASVTLEERRSRPTESTGVAAQLSSLPASLVQLVKEPAAMYAAFAQWVTPRRRSSQREMRLMPDARVPTSSEELSDFGANKLIIASTASGKLFAIEATTSEIVWTKYIGLHVKECDKTMLCGPKLQLLPSKSSLMTTLLVTTQTAHGPEAIWVDPLIGKILRQEVVASSGRVASVLPLAPQRRGSDALNIEEGSVQPFLIVDSEQKVHALPTKNAVVDKLVKESAGRLFYYEVDSTSQVVEGYVINGTVNKQELVRLWNLELGSAGEKVVASTSPEHQEWDHVPVHIKGDATILYKYINSNLLAIATEDVEDNSTALNLYVLDSITGNVLHQSHIQGAARPVHLAACDNWVVMHYHVPKKVRFELTVVELFQAKADDGPWDILFGGKINQTKSAHQLDNPVPLQQTYIFPAGVSAMGVTATLKGITPRSIMMAMTTEQIFRASKEMINPRRPYPQAPGAPVIKERGVSAQFAPTKEEPLPPYTPTIHVRQTEIVTHQLTLSKVKGIISSPSALESTSLVFCYGLDLFFSPVQSAKAYDVLSPGFNYVLVYLSVGIVVFAWAVSSFFASRKALQERWK